MQPNSLNLPDCSTCILQKYAQPNTVEQIIQQPIKQADLCIVLSGLPKNFGDTGEFIDWPKSLIGAVFQKLQTQRYPDRKPEPFVVTSAAYCSPPMNKQDSQLAGLVNCREHLFNFIHKAQSTVVLTVGERATAALFGTDKLDMKKLQGWPHKINLVTSQKSEPVWVIPCYNPGLLHFKPEDYVHFEYALQLAVDVVNNVIPRSLQGVTSTDWQLLNTADQINQYCDGLLHLSEHTPLPLACDIETSGFNFSTNEVLSIGLSHSRGVAVVIPKKCIYSENTETVQAVKRLLTLPPEKIEYIWHNGKFDINFLNFLGLEARVDQDTLLMHYALNENAGVHGLENLAGRFLGVPNYKQQLKANLDDPGDSYAHLPTATLYEYQAQDADYTRQLFLELQKILEQDARLMWMYENILVPAQNFLHEVETTGFYTHLDKLKQANEELEQQIEQVLKETVAAATPVWDAELYAQEMKAAKVPSFFNPASPQQVAWVLYRRFQCVPKIQLRADKRKVQEGKPRLPDTSEKTLRSIEPKNKFVERLLELRRLKKLHSTYVVSLLDKRSRQGRIHTTYSLFGTTTGRLSSKKPNLQNIPREQFIKDLFGAPANRLILECDYKGAELRALAMYSLDPFLIRVFQGDFDLHDETAAAVFGSDFTSEQRMQAKMINFGIMYGRGPTTISESCNITVQEAQESINKWLARMPQAANYLRTRRQAVKSGCVLVSPFGRKRRFPYVTPQHLNAFQNEACNFAIQSVASDFTLLTAIRIQPELKKHNARVINLVHDSIVIELPQDRQTAEHLFTWVPEQMEKTPALWFQLPFTFKADASMGKHWGNLKNSVEECFEELNKKEKAK